MYKSQEELMSDIEAASLKNDAMVLNKNLITFTMNILLRKAFKNEEEVQIVLGNKGIAAFEEYLKQHPDMKKGIMLMLLVMTEMKCLPTYFSGNDAKAIMNILNTLVNISDSQKDLKNYLN